MTFKDAFKGADPEEVTRRHAVVVRLNALYDKRQAAEPAQAERITRRLSEIKRTEADWLKPCAPFLY